MPVSPLDSSAAALTALFTVEQSRVARLRKRNKQMFMHKIGDLFFMCSLSFTTENTITGVSIT